MSGPVGPVNEQYPTVFTSGPLPLNLAEYEKFARNTLPRNANDYYASGSNDMITLRENRYAYSRLRILPRVLIDVSKIDTKLTILGDPVDSPVLVAPTAMQQMAQPEGEIATAKACARYLSTLFSHCFSLLLCFCLCFSV
jgi:isopentenyl diphosphate isomerase/L-lactate dehydrogenase-like FMN-dependent dehydrogenase